MFGRSSVLLTALAFVSSAQDQKPKLTARELFYSAVQTAKPAQTQERANGAAKQAPATPRERIPVPQRQLPPSPQGPDWSDGGRVFTAALTTANAGVPLGLKYAILMGATEVPVDTVFRAGDRIQLNVETNIPAYLYIISRESSRTWKPLFPSEKLFIVFSCEAEPNLEKLIYPLKGVAPAFAPSLWRPNPPRLIMPTRSS